MTVKNDKPKRKSVSKKTRFEIFKRDGFKCMYCGAHPPSALLHVDHIVAVANGGKSDIDNLITACEPCNQGKCARRLEVAPQSLAEKALSVVEREDQLRGYHEILEAKRQRLDDQTWLIINVMKPNADTVSRNEFQSIKSFIEKIGYHATLESMEIALASQASYRNTFKYFCGVCWNRVREVE